MTSSNVGRDTRPLLRPGVCDVCGESKQVRDWFDNETDDGATCCDPCEQDLRAGWEALTEAERLAVMAEIEAARSYAASGQKDASA